jgi:hypothetical protein
MDSASDLIGTLSKTVGDQVYTDIYIFDISCILNIFHDAHMCRCIYKSYMYVYRYEYICTLKCVSTSRYF